MSNVVSFPEAPRPSEDEIKGRYRVVRQGWRFAVLNLKMLGMVRKGHH